MKCLSIKQPWAGLILAGIKEVENRTWNVSHKGPLLIHAGQAMDKAAWSLFMGGGALSGREVEWLCNAAKAAQHIRGKHPHMFSCGGLIGVVTALGCWEWQAGASRWHEPGCYGLYLKNPRPFRMMIPWRGQLSVFNVPEDNQQVRLALEDVGNLQLVRNQEAR